MKNLFHPTKFRAVILAFGLAATGIACGRNVLRTGVTAPPVAPPLPTQAHPDGACDPGVNPCEQAPGYCFDLQASPGHCGACGNACPL